jgi:pectin methylesterase-like acyl-CoA thioesterase
MGRGFGVSQLMVVLAAAFLIAVPVLALEEPEAQKWYSAVENKPQADDTTTTQSSGGLDTFAKSVRTIVVDQSGKGHYKNVQKAINAVPKGNKQRVVIVIRAGVYRSKLGTM